MLKNDEMCGFLKVNFKILDKNFTNVILYNIYLYIIKNQLV